MKNNNRHSNFVFYHTKHKVIRVEEITTHKVLKSTPLKVSYAKIGMIIEGEDYALVETRKSKSRTYYEDAPRITFAGKIIPMTNGEVNSDMVEIHVGASMTKGQNHFNRKRGRDTAAGRAEGCPLLIIQCLESEVFGVFHKAVERLTPVVLDTEELMCTTEEPHVEKMSLTEILEEETAD